MNAPTLNQSVKYQATKLWLRFGSVVEIDTASSRARVLWTREQYKDGTVADVPDRTLNVRTWVAFSRLEPVSAPLPLSGNLAWENRNEQA